MNIQEVIRKMYEAGLNCKQLKCASQFDKGYNNGIAYAINLLDKLDEPEKPVVPQFVDEYIQKRRRFSKKLYDALRYSNTTLEIDDWLIESNNAEVFAKAWIYGYEVKKEKLYIVEIPNNLKGRYNALVRNHEGTIILDCFDNDMWRALPNAKLTEAEIKKDFEWAFPLAEEVEE